MTVPQGKYLHTIILQLVCEWADLLLVNQIKESPFLKDGVGFLAQELADIPYT